ncbi:hypothetical protein PT974_10688 [Cladobotryum mycophilum]|uniref:25S rRNA (uridine-N(3))-methyltransferase BMT5-like domain-containing protein n=1 Tax=Cladobotryum mycophilum TaxID=491253 RepID=A0ABR0SAP4_9HYPO
MAKRRKLQNAQRPGKPQHKPKPQGQTGGGGAGRGGGPKSSTPSQQPKAKQKHKQQQHEQPTIPFHPHDHILLIGEGDLSFAASIIQHHGCTNVTATVLEKDHAELVAKYPAVDANIAVIDRRPDPNNLLTDPNSGPGSESDSDPDGAPDSESDPESESDAPDHKSKKKTKKPAVVNNKLVYGVDATKLPSSITRNPHDHIIFNFPHVGGKSTDVNRQVRYNQELLVSFFQRALTSPFPLSRPAATSSSPSSRPSPTPCGTSATSAATRACRSIAAFAFRRMRTPATSTPGPLAS